MITYLFDEMKSSGLIGKSPRKKILKHLKVVVLDLYVAHLGDPMIYLGYPRGKNDYSKDSRMGKLFLGHRPMIRVVDGLESLGYLENHIGFYDQGKQSGYQSRMRASGKLIDLIQNYDVAPAMISRDESDFIVLHDADDKKEIPFDDTDEIVRMRQQLVSYNAFLQDHQFGLSLPKEAIRKILISSRRSRIDYTRICLYRIFNEDFTLGGRFYRGWWQNVPRELRPHITIDGEPCSELDYSGQHLLLLYHLQGDEYRWLKGLNDDPYYLEDHPEGVRNLLKLVVLILVNEPNEVKATRAIRKKIHYEFPELESTDAFIKPLIKALIDKHSEIKEYFYSGKGGDLQYQDSKIAEYVLTHMQARGQPVLPVHDSFVVQDKYIAHLYSTMKEAYRMLGIDSIPEVKLKLGANSNLRQASFRELNKQIKKEAKEQRKELKAIEELERRINNAVPL